MVNVVIIEDKYEINICLEKKKEKKKRNRKEKH